MSRVVAWFSCGDASAVACALALKMFGRAPWGEIVIARIVIDNEHKDNDRFARECAEWYGQPIIELRSDEYKDAWDVWESRKYVAGIAGAPCTTELKKRVRFKFQRPDDMHVFGYTKEEPARAETFKRSNPEIDVTFPLLLRGLSKADCHALVRNRGIELPAMYRLGFNNNNCIGCPKGGAGYWNMIRKHFPDNFNRMDELTHRLGARLVKQDGKRIFLRELRPETGRQQDEVEISCTPMCESAEADLETIS
jgi:3'-phosphoadenosine 5'-phosphosulfate sulfotransferase (PAPS reductase)/FAD synthetase